MGANKISDIDMDSDGSGTECAEEYDADYLKQDNSKSSNVLKFYPYINNKLTRSVGTLNLSLSNVNLSKEAQRPSNKIEEYSPERTDNDVDQCINKWTPFNESSENMETIESNFQQNSMHTPIKLKRTVSKSELSPFINEPGLLKKLNYKINDKNRLSSSNLLNTWSVSENKNELPEDIEIDIDVDLDVESESFNNSKSLKRNTNSASVNKNSSSFIGAKPDQAIFKSEIGLKSKLHADKDRKSHLKKFDVPDTPMKKFPLLENKNLSNISNISQNSFTDLDFFRSFLDSPESSLKNNKENISNSQILSATQEIDNSQSPTLIKNTRILINGSSPLNRYNENTNVKGNDNYNDKDKDTDKTNKTAKTFNMHNEFGNKNHGYSYINNATTKFQNKYKKIKKSRNSVIFQNNELTNSIQQFTDDLYGPVDSYSNTPTPPSLGSNSDHQTNTRKNSREYTNNESNNNNIENYNNNIEVNELTPTSHKRMAGSTVIRPPQQYDLYNSSPTSKFTSPVRNRHLANKIDVNPDSHLFERFINVSTIGDGQFSKVFQVTFAQTSKKYAVKSIQLNKYNSLKRILQEIKILSEISNDKSSNYEGREHILNFISSWKYLNCFYIMTEYCENGNLDQFIQEQVIAKNTRLEDWRIWKIIVELSLALRYIHERFHIVHLDLKPANVMITFEGNLRLGDFGMATHLPLEDKSFENEGDVEYIAPEIISDSIYDYRADIFSLGLLIVEIAANVVLPDNGNAWHKLRSGDLSDAGRLSSTDIHSTSLFSNRSKIDTTSSELSTFMSKYTKSHDNHLLAETVTSKIPPWVPHFLIYGESLEKIVKWMIEPNYKLRPTADQILQTEECIYVEMTRKAGAVIQEDDYGPKPNFFYQDNNY
ncbi:hypothetical protein TPHA_0A02630 [Tetrapisispora phaffii CBS 4417]|uniref:Protein kinase domain-containing protein n=1 Tax=Tetrapisispora phaffii (strain ATCC 24235 / CBS 4417 / NBRC 1672 / NRRL Y-8282 / UCD 70-5) TaxID=1071381 RepID=G8BN67_TETPH|nr:hypothetical protein TPHA_0A02630 [Tetrapisispora phaffii CBS 4417]CCE61345.1 hypothetical protein TPHA_0A02630 [Tetrapisispora phaffii CBS 4417]